jgi:hypothetical protein
VPGSLPMAGIASVGGGAALTGRSKGRLARQRVFVPRAARYSAALADTLELTKYFEVD